jgi:hypothetical protein
MCPEPVEGRIRCPASNDTNAAICRDRLTRSTRRVRMIPDWAGFSVEIDRSGALWAATLGNANPPAPGTLVKIVRVRANP